MFGISTYWDTIRYLRPAQVFGRLWFRIPRARPRTRPTPNLRKTRGAAWVLPARRAPSLVDSEQIRLLNETGDISREGWDNPSRTKLWRYNLHYFGDLNADRADTRAAWHHALIHRWIRDNPPTRGTGWEPYPTSLRIVNWVKWALAGNRLEPDALESLAVQARWLRKRLEFHLLGNHLFSNGKALVFAGLLFDGPEAEGWLAEGMRILHRQVPEQILGDGGQFELSPMYHALALEDLLDLWNITRTYCTAFPDRWRADIEAWSGQIAKMLNWLGIMSHPDGEISYFNDAVQGFAPRLAELQQYAGRLSLRWSPVPAGRTHWLKESGYVRIEAGPAIALLDVARIGPDYLPAHAHADTLSFELSIFGQRVLVNTGTSCYGDGAERLRQRGSAAHNTVVVDERDSSEVWSGFRVAARARPAGLVITEEADIEVRCSHDGYHRLVGHPHHGRSWRVSEDTMVIEDQITGTFTTAEAHFHFHPSVRLVSTIETDGEVAYVLALAGGEQVRCAVQGGIPRWEDSRWCAEFGLMEPGLCLVARIVSPVLRTTIRWGNSD